MNEWAARILSVFPERSKADLNAFIQEVSNDQAEQMYIQKEFDVEKECTPSFEQLSQECILEEAQQNLAMLKALEQIVNERMVAYDGFYSSVSKTRTCFDSFERCQGTLKMALDSFFVFTEQEMLQSRQHLFLGDLKRSLSDLRVDAQRRLADYQREISAAEKEVTTAEKKLSKSKEQLERTLDSRTKMESFELDGLLKMPKYSSTSRDTFAGNASFSKDQGYGSAMGGGGGGGSGGGIGGSSTRRESMAEVSITRCEREIKEDARALLRAIDHRDQMLSASRRAFQKLDRECKHAAFYTIQKITDKEVENNGLHGTVTSKLAGSVMAVDLERDTEDFIYDRRSHDGALMLSSQALSLLGDLVPTPTSPLSPTSPDSSSRTSSRNSSRAPSRSSSISGAGHGHSQQYTSPSTGRRNSSDDDSSIGGGSSIAPLHSGDGASVGGRGRINSAEEEFDRSETAEAHSVALLHSISTPIAPRNITNLRIAPAGSAETSAGPRSMHHPLPSNLPFSQSDFTAYLSQIFYNAGKVTAGGKESESEDSATSTASPTSTSSPGAQASPEVGAGVEGAHGARDCEGAVVSEAAHGTAGAAALSKSRQSSGEYFSANERESSAAGRESGTVPLIGAAGHGRGRSGSSMGDDESHPAFRTRPSVEQEEEENGGKEGVREERGDEDGPSGSKRKSKSKRRSSKGGEGDSKSKDASAISTTMSKQNSSSDNNNTESSSGKGLSGFFSKFKKSDTRREVKISKADQPEVKSTLLAAPSYEWIEQNPHSYLRDAVEWLARAVKTQAGRDAFITELNQFRSRKVEVGDGFDALGAALWTALNYCQAENDVHNAKVIMMLSQTFYRKIDPHQPQHRAASASSSSGTGAAANTSASRKVSSTSALANVDGEKGAGDSEGVDGGAGCHHQVVKVKKMPKWSPKRRDGSRRGGRRAQAELAREYGSDGDRSDSDRDGPGDCSYDDNDNGESNDNDGDNDDDDNEDDDDDEGAGRRGAEHRHYIKERLLQHPIWQDGNYWEQALWQCAIEQLQTIPYERCWHDMDREGRQRAVRNVHDVIFSQVMAITHSMMELGCALEQCREFLYRMCVIHQLSEAQRQQLLRHLTKR